MNSTHTNFKVVKYELVLIGSVDYSFYQLGEYFRFYLSEAFFVLDDLWEEESGQISVVYKHIWQSHLILYFEIDFAVEDDCTDAKMSQRVDVSLLTVDSWIIFLKCLMDIEYFFELFWGRHFG